jgi:adenosine deaminase
VQDAALMKRLARDRILVECCLTSNYQTGSVARTVPHPIFAFLDAGVPVAICTDNTTVSSTDIGRENLAVAATLGEDAVAQIHSDSRAHSFISSVRTEAGGRPRSA